MHFPAAMHPVQSFDLASPYAESLDSLLPSLWPVSCRYAELAAAMHSLNADYQDQQLDVQLERLESAVVDFLTRASHNFSV